MKLRLSPDVLDHFRAGGAGWQTRINETLERAAPARKEAGEGVDVHAPFAISRSLNFWIFPVLVFGTSPNTTWRGTL